MSWRALRPLAAALPVAGLLFGTTDSARHTTGEEEQPGSFTQELRGQRAAHRTDGNVSALSELSNLLQRLGCLARCDAAAQFASPTAAHGMRRQQRSQKQQDFHGHSQQEPAAQQQQHSDRRRMQFHRQQEISGADLAARNPKDAARLRQLATALWQEQQQLEPHARVAAAAAHDQGGLLVASCSSGTDASTSLAASGPAAAGSTPHAAKSGQQSGANTSDSRGSLPPRFTDAELMRFAIMTGYAHAPTAAERQASLQRAAEHVARTCAWLAHHTFAAPELLQQYQPFIFWDKQPDPQGRPVLHIRMGAAMQHCKGAEAMQFANVIITQTELAVRERLRDGGPEQLVVVMDCKGASALLAARISWVFKAVSLTLNHHYPARLHRLELVDLPVMLQWLVGGVKKLVQPATREKVAVVQSAASHPAGEPA